MAKYIGRTLSGGVMVLCMVLLFTPETHSQGFVARKKMLTISGSVGQPGVTMQGLPMAPAPMTDENGVYSVQVEYGWSDTVTPVKAGYTFEPKQRIYEPVKDHKTADDYVATPITFTISGSAGQPQVKMTGFPNDPVSDPAGRYRATVPYGWTGMVMPEKEGYSFEPYPQSYEAVYEDKKNDNYTASALTFTISGSVSGTFGGVEGVVLKGLPNDPKTGTDGTYRVEVPYAWSGTVTPDKEGHEFTLESRTYTDVKEPHANQDYTATVFMFEISGNAGEAGVVLDGLPGDPITDVDGAYTTTVQYGFSGKVTPTKAGFTFTPPFMPYAKVTEDKADQDYKASIVRIMISGNAGIGSAVLTDLPGKVTSDASGFYAATVDYGWEGTIAPQKEGYEFDPPSVPVPPVTQDLAKQDFTAKPLTFTISGNAGMDGVMLEGLPGRPMSGPDGSYTATVGWKWGGTVIPKKPGYMFDPPKNEYADVTASRTDENYTASIIQHTIAGKVRDKSGPVADVFILADNDGGSDTTDSNGVYEISVNRGWRGRLVPQKDGYTFTPASRELQTVIQDIPNVDFAGEIKMMTVTDSIIFGEEPIQGVTVTANPGDTTATTDAKGKYTIRVPYGWTGELVPEKEGFDFFPATFPYTNVTENIDKTAPVGLVTMQDETSIQPTIPTREAGGITPTVPTELVPDQPVPTGAVPPIGTAQTERDLLMQRINALQNEVRTLGGQAALGGELTTIPLETTIPPPGPSMLPTEPQVHEGPVVNGDFAGDILDVLTKISEMTGVQIYVDGTVKPGVIQPTRLIRASVPAALQTVLSSAGYMFKKMDDAYLVYLPIANTFVGDELRQALSDISAIAGIPIIPDETVTGEVFATLTNIPLEEALDMILSGTPYVVKKMPNYYLVADRSTTGSAFPKISETHHIRLNYISPNTAKGLLSPAFAEYVQAGLDPNSHVVMVTAPSALAERIVTDLQTLDVRPRHVLLDARIVAMEHGDLLNLGVEWNFPMAQAGFFADSYARGTITTGNIPAGKWPWGIQVGFSFDRTFTNSLMAALNMLQENSQIDMISSPQVLGQDGKRSEIRAITEEYYMMTSPLSQNLYYSQSQLETITSGTTLSITPFIGDNNDITLEMAVEVSDSIPRGRGNDLPVVTRRTARNSVTIRDGGTVAVAGLTENRSRSKEKRVPGLGDIPLLGGLFRNNDSDQATREIAVFVTANLVPEHSMVAGGFNRPGERAPAREPAAEDFRRQLEESLSRE